MQTRFAEQSLSSTFIKATTDMVGKMVVFGGNFSDNRVKLLGDDYKEKLTEKRQHDLIPRFLVPDNLADRVVIAVQDHHAPLSLLTHPNPDL